MYRHPIWFEPPVGCESLLMVSNLHNEHLSVGLCHVQGTLLLAGPLSHYPQCHNGLAPSRKTNTCAFVAQCPEEVHNMTYERVFRIFALNRLQARHWVWVEYNIMLYRLHVPIIVQCQGNGCSLSSKILLLSGSLLDSWWQVVSPFWKWRLITAAAPTLSLILDPSV